MNKLPLGNEAYEGSIFQEALFANEQEMDEFDSFHFEQCIKCNYAERVFINTEIIENEILNDLYLNYKINYPKHSLHLMKGVYLWHFICSKCKK